MSGLELLHALRESERDHVVIKIKISGDKKPLIGVVDQIVGKEVIFKPYTLFGEKIHKTIVPVSAIEKLVKIHLPYSNGIFPIVNRNPLPKKTARKRFKNQLIRSKK